jgi:hypothetical protein
MSLDDYKDDPDFADFDILSHEAYEDDNTPSQVMPDTDDVERDIDTYDQYFGASERVPIGDTIQAGRVTGRKRELNVTM